MLEIESKGRFMATNDRQAQRPSRIPPLAGLASYERAAVPGYSVDRNVALLRRYNWIERKLYELMAAKMNPTPEWEVKCAFGLHMYLDSEHALAIRARVAELRKPPHHLDVAPDEALERFLIEALHSHGTVEVMAAIFDVIRPALLAAYEAHRDATNPVFDQPTVRLLRIAADEEREALLWGKAALRGVIDGDVDRSAEASAWVAHLKLYLVAAGGVSGEEPIPSDLILPASRSNAVDLKVDVDPRRDGRCNDIYNFSYRPNDVYKDPSASYEERNLALMFKRYHEMDVPEVMAAIVAQTPGKPWQYYADMARQLWDEARHAMMGEVWFVSKGIDYTQFPNHVGWCSHLNLDCTATERHLILYGIEQNLMHGQTGKKYEWEIAQQANDSLTIYFQDYDWADEVLHAQIGRKWLRPEADDPEPLLEKVRRANEIETKIRSGRSDSTPQTDWWPDFVQSALGKASEAKIPDRLVSGDSAADLDKADTPAGAVGR